MKPVRRRAGVWAIAVAVAAVQLAAAGNSYKAIEAQLAKVMKGNEHKGPTPEVDLEKPMVARPGQTVDVTIPGKNFGANAVAYFQDPFIDHIAQKTVSPNTIKLTVSISPEAWPGTPLGVLACPASNRRTYFEGLSIPGRLAFDFRLQNGARLHLVETAIEEGGQMMMDVEYFKPGSQTAMKGTATFTRSDSNWMGDMKSEKDDLPCYQFDLDLDSIGPGKEFTGKVMFSDDQPDQPFKGKAQRLQ